jgi:hypothetical protein
MLFFWQKESAINHYTKHPPESPTQKMLPELLGFTEQIRPQEESFAWRNSIAPLYCRWVSI